MGIADREKNRESKARQEAVKQMMSTSAEVEQEVLSEAGPEFTEAPKETESKPEPKRKGRPTVKRETKKRYTLTFLPSVYDKASAKASEEGKSLSEVLGDFLAKYIKQ